MKPTLSLHGYCNPKVRRQKIAPQKIVEQKVPVALQKVTEQKIAAPKDSGSKSYHLHGKKKSHKNISSLLSNYI